MVNIEGISKEALLLELLKNAGKISSEDKYENIGYAAEYLKSHKYYFEGIDFSSNQIDETFYEKKYGVSVRKIVDDLKLNPNKYKFNPLDMFKVIEESLYLDPNELRVSSNYYHGNPFCGIYQSYEKTYLRKKVVTNSSVNLAHVQDYYYTSKYAIVSIEDKPINLKDGYLYGIIRDMSGAVLIELRDHGDSASECIILDKSDFPKDFVVGDFVRLSGDFLNKGEKRDCIRHLSSNDINVSKITKDNKQEILEYGDIDLVIYFGKIDFLSSFLKVCETNDYYKIKSVLNLLSDGNNNTLTSEVKSTILDVLIDKDEEIIKNFIRLYTGGRKLDNVTYSLFHDAAESKYVFLLRAILYRVFKRDISEFNSNYISKARKKHAKIRDISYKPDPVIYDRVEHYLDCAKLPSDLEKVIETIENYIKSGTYDLGINREISSFIYKIKALLDKGVLDKNKIIKMLTGLQTVMISTDNLRSCITGEFDYGYSYIFKDFPELFYQLEKAYPQYYFYNLVFNHKKLIETDEELYMKQMEEFSFDVVKMNDIECMKNFVSALDSAELSEKFEQKKQEIILRVKKVIDDLKSKDPKYVEEFVKRVEQMELIFKKEQEDCVSYSKALSNFNKDIENNIRPSQYSNEMQNLSCYSYMFGQGEYSTCKKEINSKEIVKLLDVFVGEVQTRIYSSQSEKARKYYITDAQIILKGSFEQFCTKKEEFSIEDRIFFEMLALNTLKQIKRLQTEIYSINSEELNTMINTLNSYYESDIKLYQEKTGLSFKDSSDVSISISNTGQEYPGSGEGGMSSK